METPKLIYLNKQQQSEGVRLCNLKSRQLLDDAEKLVSNGGSLNNAFALYIFAVEEYGKAKLLQEFIYTPLCLIDKKKFANHQYKIQKGLDNLDPCCKKIELAVKVDVASERTITVRTRKTKYNLDEVISIPFGLTGNFETVGYEPVKEVIRWGCIYTDFDETNQEWLGQIIPDRDDLLNAISTFIGKF